MRLSLRVSIAVLAPAALVSAAALPAFAQDKGGIFRFGMGPLQPTPSETTKAHEPLFAYVAKKLNREFDLVATTDWAGISVTLVNNQVTSRGWGRGATSSPIPTPA
jgi:ABC-type phosphate/phosphonate transport system substrate-binding protein